MNTLADLFNADSQPWMNNPDRPCAGSLTPDLWFPNERQEKAATRLCDGCPVRVDCLKYAVDQKEEHGIWGGTTPSQRATIVRNRYRRTAAQVVA